MARRSFEEPPLISHDPDKGEPECEHQCGTSSPAGGKTGTGISPLFLLEYEDISGYRRTVKMTYGLITAAVETAYRFGNGTFALWLVGLLSAVSLKPLRCEHTHGTVGTR